MNVYLAPQSGEGGFGCDIHTKAICPKPTKRQPVKRRFSGKIKLSQPPEA
jgi:hypothetical protein